MKKILALLLSLLLVIALSAGCSNTQNETPQTEKSSIEKTPATQTPAEAEASGSALKPEDIKADLEIWHMGASAEWVAAFNQYVEDFESTYPNIKIEVLELGNADGDEKLTVAMATNATPDIFSGGAFRISPAQSANFLLPVTDVVETSLADGLIKESVYNFTASDGELYMAPMTGIATYSFSVNYTLAEELGVAGLLPADHTVPWSYDECYAFLKAAADAGKPKNIYGTQLSAGSQSNDTCYFNLMFTNGSPLLNDDHTKFVLQDNPKAIEAMNFLKRLVDDGITPAGTATTVDTDVQTNFLSGNIVANFVWGNINPVNWTKKMDAGETEYFEIRIYQSPTSEGKAQPTAIGAGGGCVAMCVYKNDGDEMTHSAAKLFISSVYADAGMMSSYVAMGVDAYSTIASSDAGSERANALLNVTAALTELSDGYVGLTESWWSGVRPYFYPQLQAFFTGEKTAKEALGDFAADAQAVADEALGA